MARSTHLSNHVNGTLKEDLAMDTIMEATPDTNEEVPDQQPPQVETWPAARVELVQQVRHILQWPCSTPGCDQICQSDDPNLTAHLGEGKVAAITSPCCMRTYNIAKPLLVKSGGNGKPASMLKLVTS